MTQEKFHLLFAFVRLDRIFDCQWKLRKEYLSMDGARVITKVQCTPDQCPECWDTFIQDVEFTSTWNRLGYTDDDLRDMEVVVRLDSSDGNNPGIPGAGGISQVEFETTRGALIVIWYICFREVAVTYLLAVHDGDIEDNYTEDELLKLRNKVAEVTAEIHRPRMV